MLERGVVWESKREQYRRRGIQSLSEDVFGYAQIIKVASVLGLISMGPVRRVLAGEKEGMVTYGVNLVILRCASVPPAERMVSPDTNNLP